MHSICKGLSYGLTRALGLAVLAAVHACALPACGAVSKALVASAACLVDPTAVLVRWGRWGGGWNSGNGGAPALTVHLGALVTVRLGCTLETTFRICYSKSACNILIVSLLTCRCVVSRRDG